MSEREGKEDDHVYRCTGGLTLWESQSHRSEREGREEDRRQGKRVVNGGLGQGTS